MLEPESTVRNAIYDVEMQQSLLQQQEVSVFRTLILLFHSVQLFKSNDHSAPSLLSTSSADHTCIVIDYEEEEEEEEEVEQDEGIATPPEIFADSDRDDTQDEGIATPPEVSADSDRDLENAQDEGITTPPEISADSDQEHILSLTYERVRDIDLQTSQRKAISLIVKSKNVQELESFGGVRGIAHALNTDLEYGISSIEENYKYRPAKQLQLSIFFRCFLKAWNSYPIILLVAASALSLSFEITKQGWESGWVNGSLVFLVAFITVSVNALRNYLQEKSLLNKFETYWLSAWRENTQVMRRCNQGAAAIIDIPASALRVGDLVILKRGSTLPAEGIYVAGECLEVEGDSKSTVVDETNLFLFCGWRVIGGNGLMIVTSVGIDTELGEMMSHHEIVSLENKCKFETCLNKVNTCIQTIGIAVLILINIALFIRYQIGKIDDDGGFKTDPKGEPTPLKPILEAVKGIVSGSKFGTTKVLTLLSVSLVGAVEGIPVVISLAAVYWNCKILAHKAWERDSLACLKMASVTTICTDKLGGLTEHEEEVDMFLFGEQFINDGSHLSSPNDVVLEDLCHGISTLELIPSVVCDSKLVAINSWAEAKIGLKRGPLYEQCNILENEDEKNPFVESSMVRMVKNGREYLHYKGPPQHILNMCSHYYDRDGKKQAIDPKRRMFEDLVRDNLAEGKAVAFACTNFLSESDDEAISSIESNPTILLGMIGLKSTKREETKRSVLTLRESGIRVILASKDDVADLERIGQNSGLLSPDSNIDLVIPGEEFRRWNDEQKKTDVGKICIIGNCLPSDKIDLLKCLKQNGEIVAMLGQRTIDAPALKEADIGLTLGSWSSEVARLSSQVHISDTDLSFLVPMIHEAKHFHENIQKFVQLQVIFSISSSFINFLATVLYGDAPVTAVELFWMNLLLAIVGGFALLTGPPNGLVPRPNELSRVYVTKAIWRNVAIQASYQTVVFVSLPSELGKGILGIKEEEIVESMIYLGFCLCQFFNMFLAREPEDKNIFRGLFQIKHRIMFFVALVIFVLLQAVFLAAEKLLEDVPCLNWKLLSVCFVIGIVSWLLDFGGKWVSSFINTRLSANRN